MFEASRKPEDTRNTLTAFLLTVAFVFIPSVLIFFHPLSYVVLGLAATASVLCLAIARLSWKRSARPPVASVAIINQSGR